MNKQIKIKIYDSKYNEFFFPNEVIFKDGEILCFNTKKIASDNKTFVISGFYDVEHFKILYSIGIKDINGVELYTGDKVNVVDGDNGETGIIKYGYSEIFDGCCGSTNIYGFYLEVENEKSKMFNYTGYHIDSTKKYKKIGNIYEVSNV